MRKLGGQVSPTSSLRFNRTSIRGVFLVCSYEGSSGMILTFWFVKEAFGMIRMRRGIEGFILATPPSESEGRRFSFKEFSS